MLELHKNNEHALWDQDGQINLHLHLYYKEFHFSQIQMDPFVLILSAIIQYEYIKKPQIHDPGMVIEGPEILQQSANTSFVHSWHSWLDGTHSPREAQDLPHMSAWMPSQDFPITFLRSGIQIQSMSDIALLASR